MKRLLLVLLTLCVCACVPAMAIIVQPGDKVYFNETVDITLVVGTTGQFAWWGDNQYGQIPEIIAQAQNFQHKYWIDPSKFRVGKWYKWDNIYEPNSNSLAFEVIPGTRPSPTPTPGNYTDILITPVPTPTQYKPSNTHILIAKGDGLTFDYYGIPGEYGTGHIWLYGRTSGIIDEPLTLKNSIYTFDITNQITEGLATGWYTGYLQFEGKNGLQDVFYNRQEQTLDTPYDDALIPDVSIVGFLPQRIQSEFELLSKNKDRFDDILIPITMEVQEPIIRFTDYYEENDNIIINGNSPMATGVTISFVIDPDRWTTTADMRSRTKIATLNGNINEPRIFHISIPVNWNELAMGWHTVVGTIKQNKIEITQHKDFEVKEIYINPQPTQEQRKVIVEEYGWHIVNNTNVSFAKLSNGTVIDLVRPTPQIIYITQTPLIVYVNQTPSPEPTEEPASTPISPILGIVALVICAYTVLRRR